MTDEINKNVTEILKFVEIEDQTSNNFIRLKHDEWRRIGFPESNKTLILKNNATFYFFNIKQNLREYCSEKNYRLSENYLNNTINDFLISCKLSNISQNDVRTQVKNLLDKIDDVNLHEYRVFLPVNHYDYRDNFTVDTVKIVKIDNDLFKKYFTYQGRTVDSPNVDNLIEHNNTDVGAIITVKAHDIEAAKELAEELLDKFVFSIKLFDFGSFISTRKYSYDQVNYCTLIYDKSTQGVSSRWDEYYPLARTTPPDEFYKKLENKWKKLTSFLYSEHLTTFQKSILDSMYWYGSTDNLRDSNTKQFLHCLFGLEKILLKKYESQKGKKFAKHMAIIFSGDHKYADSYRKYYDKRNDLVHDENTRIYDEEVMTLKINFRELLLDMIENHDKYENIESYYKEKYKIDL